MRSRLFMGLDTKKSALDGIIREFVKKRLTMPVERFAKLVGIDGGYFRRLMNGESRWQSWHIEVVAKGLDVDPAVLLNPSVEELLKKAKTQTASDINPLLEMTRVVIESDTKFGKALIENIEAFHLAVTGKEDCTEDPPLVANGGPG